MKRKKITPIMKAGRLTTMLIKLAEQPTRYDNKTDRWGKWERNAWNVDCVRAIKMMLWGFSFNTAATHGGAVYLANGFPDLTTEGMIERCYDVSTNMDKDAIEPGELLWMPGHNGIYLGYGAVGEAAGSLKGYAITDLTYQPWQKHGKLPDLDYTSAPAPVPGPQLRAGEQLNLDHEPLYASSSRKEPANHVTGRYFLTDGKLIRGRVRICQQITDVNKIDRVTGWIDWRW